MKPARLRPPVRKAPRIELFPDISIGDAPISVAKKGRMMTLTPLQKRAARKARNHSGLDMNLVALIDIFTILIFFLMSSTGVEVLTSSKAVKLPESTAEKMPRETIVVTVSGTDILVGGRKVATGGGRDGHRWRPDRAAEGRARPAGRPSGACARRTRRRARPSRSWATRTSPTGCCAR